MKAPNFSPLEEKEARHLLESDKKSDTIALQNWLAMLPAATSLDVLAKIAGVMPARHNWIGVGFALFLFAMLCFIVGMANGWSLGAAPFVGVFILLVITPAIQHNQRLARKAALLLSYRDDYRAVAPLVRAWDARPAVCAKSLRDSEALEKALTRLLTALTEKTNTTSVEEAARDLLNRAFPPPSKWGKSLPEEFSESRADLLLAALRYLAHTTAGKESLQSRELITRIATYPVRSFTPNRSLIYEIAAASLDPAQPVVPHTSAETVAQSVGIRL